MTRRIGSAKPLDAMPQPRQTPTVIVTRELADTVMDRLEALFDTRNNRGDTVMSRAALAAAMAECDVLVPTVTDDIDAALIAGAGPRLKLIANYGAGVNHNRAQPRARARIIVTNTPGVLTEDTAERRDGADRLVPRRLARGREAGARGPWHGWSPGGMLGPPYRRKALGNRRHGADRPGGGAARARLRARHPLPQPPRLPAVLEDELAATYHGRSRRNARAIEHLSIHTPLNADSRDLIDRRRIGLMRRHVHVINTSRGGILDEVALVDALEAGQLAGAGLDVWEHEPRIDPRLLALPNCGDDAAYGNRRRSRAAAPRRAGHPEHPHVGRRPSPARSGARRLGVSRLCSPIVRKCV